MATAALETQPGQGLNGPDPQLMQKQSGIWNTLMDRYFRLDFEGFEKLPDEPCLLIGVHSGGPLTMDAWTVIMAWWREFGDSRALHGTAHDVLICIQTGNTRQSKTGMSYTREHYLKTRAEMGALFAAHPEALENSLAIAERCQFAFEQQDLQLPVFPVPDGYDLDAGGAQVEHDSERQRLLVKATQRGRLRVVVQRRGAGR